MKSIFIASIATQERDFWWLQQGRFIMLNVHSDNFQYAPCLNNIEEHKIFLSSYACMMYTTFKGIYVMYSKTKLVNDLITIGSTWTKSPFKFACCWTQVQAALCHVQDFFLLSARPFFSTHVRGPMYCPFPLIWRKI